jgi:hypothetical protein
VPSSELLKRMDHKLLNVFRMRTSSPIRANS